MVDLDKIAPVNYKDTDVNTIHVIRKNGLGKFDHDGMKRYISTKYYQTNEDWYATNEADVQTFAEFPFHRCDVDDFGSDKFPENKEFFNSWAGFLVLCPDTH